MKTGLTLQDLAATLDRQRRAAEDLLVDTRDLTLFADPDPAKTEVEVRGLEEPFRLNEYAQRQVASRLGFPIKLWDRFRDKHPDLLMNDVNALFRREPERRMLRTFDWSQVQDTPSNDRVARAFLSDRYRRLDNYDLVSAVLPTLNEIPDARVESCQVTDKRLYLKVVCPRTEGEVAQGDVVQAGFVVSNSEVGSGSLSVQPMIFRLVCLNGMVAGKATRTFHLGGKSEAEQETYKILTDEARKADDKALFLKLRDVMRATADETTFNSLLKDMQEAAGTEPMAAPIQGVERLAKKVGLSEDEQNGVLQHLLRDGDLSLWGVTNAITRTSQDVASYDRATELEALGGEVLNMTAGAWQELAAA